MSEKNGYIGSYISYLTLISRQLSESDALIRREI